MSLRVNYPQQSPEAYKYLMEIEKVMGNSTVDKKINDLVKIRVSQINGCIFCADMHTKEARKHEERELRVHHLMFWRESKLFTAKEKAALQWAELLTTISHYGVTDEDFGKARLEFSEKELSDLTFAIGTINLWNRLGVAFRPTPGDMDKMMGLDKVGLV